MGIDAAILVRGVHRSIVTDRQLLVWSWDICRALGADKFYFSEDPVAPAITRTERIGEDYSEVCDGALYEQDGPDIVAEPWECLLEVNVWTRYYGVGYERGDVLFLCAVAEWVEQNIPGAEVWYGGDSSGVCVEPWPDSERRKLREHLYSLHGRDYCGLASNSGILDGVTVQPPPCSLCVPSRQRVRFGWGNGGQYHALACHGCGKKFRSEDNGRTWTQEARS